MWARNATARKASEAYQLSCYKMHWHIVEKCWFIRILIDGVNKESISRYINVNILGRAEAAREVN
jgi:hypothetical protein